MGLDAVELLMAWEKTFGISISDEQAAAITTPRMAIDLIAEMLRATDDSKGACLTLRGFYRLRNSMMAVAGEGCRCAGPDAKIKTLLGSDWRQKWQAVKSHCGIPLPKPGWPSRHTIPDMASWIITHAARDLKNPGEAWTRVEVRTVVRAVVTDQLGIRDFDDNDRFIDDLRVD